MKTIATAAVLMMLTVAAWAEDPESKANANTATDSEPIVLGEAEMDGVVAGDRVLFNYHHFHNAVIDVRRESLDKVFDSEIGVQFVRRY